MDIKTVLVGLRTLRTLSGNEQIEFLNNIKDDLYKEIFEYTYDTHKKYKIDEGKYNKASSHLGLIGYSDRELDNAVWNEFKEILDNLAEIKSASDKTVAKVKNFIETITEEESRNFLKMVLFKDLRIGMNIKKFQKVWPDFCVLYPYMGCRPFNMKNLEAVNYPAYAQTKMDGSFCNIIIDPINKTVEYSSRQSKPQKMQGTLDDIFLTLKVPEKFVFTGEILVWDTLKDKPLERKLSNGILRRDDKTQEEKDSIRFICWDCLPYTKFIEKRWDKPYTERFELLCHYFEQIASPRLNTVNTWVVNDVQEAMERFNQEYAKGEEGVVIKAFNQIWQEGKPAGQVKIKAEKDCDLQMIEFFEGKGLYANKCGSIRCISKDSQLEVMVKPRTPEDAQEIWNNQGKYLNKILTVKYNEKIESDTKNKISLYLPVFVEIRDDKVEADNLEQIQ